MLSEDNGEDDADFCYSFIEYSCFYFYPTPCQTPQSFHMAILSNLTTVGSIGTVFFAMPTARWENVTCL